MNKVSISILFTISLLWSGLIQAEDCDLHLKPEHSLIEKMFKGQHSLEVKDIKTTHLQVPSSKHFKSAHSTHQDIAKYLGERADYKSTKTVIYPAVGYDAATAFTLFGQANLVIGLDNHPFITSDVSELKIKPILQDDDSFAHFYEVDKREHIAAEVIARLAAITNNFRLLSVKSIKDTSEESKKVFDRISLITTYTGPVFHGLIKFDSGPGTPVKSYLHLQTDLHLNTATQKLAWLDILTKHGFDAMVIKASMGALEGYSFHGFGSVVYQRLLDSVKFSEGLILDGDEIPWKWTPDGYHLAQPNHEVEIDYINLIGFGYHKLRLLKFKDLL